MSWQEWDSELDLLARDLAKLRTPHQGGPIASAGLIPRRKVAIVQLQVNIDRKIEKIRKICARDLLLLPRDHTLVHWSGVFCDTIRRFMPLASDVSSKKLWLKLIRIRLGEPGDQTPLGLMEPDELVELTLRKADLAKTERMLARSLVSLDERRKDLYLRYGLLEIKQAMAEAAGSLPSRLGADVDDALSSPTIKALANFLHGLATHTTQETPEVGRWDRVESQSARLMRMARQFIYGLAEGRAPSARNKERYRSMLAQLNDLEEETRADVAALEIPYSHPPLKLSGANSPENR